MSKSHISRLVVLILSTACAPLATAHTDVELQIASVTEKLRRHPDNYSLYLLRGELRRNNMDWRGAEADFDRAEQLGADQIGDELLLYRGNLLQQAGQSRKAVAELDNYLAINPKHIDALRVRALANAQMGAFDAAIADYSRLIGLEPARSPELWLERARLWIRIQRVEEAIASLGEATELFGPLVSLIVPIVDTEVGRKNYAAALDRIDHLPSALAETPEWLMRRGELLDALNRPGDAAKVYAQARQAISRMPLHRQNTEAVQELLARLD